MLHWHAEHPLHLLNHRGHLRQKQWHHTCSTCQEERCRPWCLPPSHALASTPISGSKRQGRWIIPTLSCRTSCISLKQYRASAARAVDTYPSTIEFHVTMSLAGIPSNTLSASPTILRQCLAWRRTRSDSYAEPGTRRRGHRRGAWARAALEEDGKGEAVRRATAARALPGRPASAKPGSRRCGGTRPGSRRPREPPARRPGGGMDRTSVLRRPVVVTELPRRERATGSSSRGDIGRRGWVQPAERRELAIDQEDGGGAQP